MKIEIRIPQSVVDKLKNLNLTDEEVVEVYKEYLAFMLQADAWDSDGITEFLFWLEHQENLLEEYKK
tara:strand:- start:85 stop:285 length:201 start_codon:yes stop_codon:yes gene_type:complete